MKKLWRLLFGAAVSFDANDGWAYSSHIALSMLMAIFPFCIFSLTLAGQLSTDLNPRDVVELIFGVWPDQVAAPIEREILAVLVASDTTKLTVSGILTMFFASNGVDAIRTAMTDAYRDTDPRPFWKTRLLCMVFVLCGGFLLTVAGALIVAVPLYFEFLETSSPGLYVQVFSNDAVRASIAVALLIVLLIACHRWLPGVRHPLAAIMPGVALTLFFWAITAQAFAIYIRNFAFYSVTYAGLEGVMAAIFFMYLMAALFLFGAEFNGQLMRNAKN